MKIGVNARFLTKPFTGIGQHTRYLFAALAQQNPQDHFLMVTPENLPEHVQSSMPKNVEIIVIPEKFPGTAGMRKTYWEQKQVPAFFLQNQVDLAHFPYPSNPWRGFSKPTCVTVHDTIPWTLPAYRKSLASKLYHDRCKNAVKKADHIFTVSKASQKEIEEICSVPSEKISISSNAPAPVFFQKLPEDQKKSVLQKYGLDPLRPYFFYIGGFDERKNVHAILKVFHEKIAPLFDIDLVLAGGKSLQSGLYGSYDELTNLASRTNVEPQKGKIVPIGFVTEEDLPALYQSCFAFLSLSTKEGCNLPLLEAAVSGAVTVASDLPVHREMVGATGLFVAPHDESTFSEMVKKLFTDSNFYREQKQKFASYRCPFSWGKTAQEVMGIYRKSFTSQP